MTLLVGEEELRKRASVVSTAFAPLADGLTAELAPLRSRDLYIPREKALLSRVGGRCARDGATLEFDPFSPYEHRCPVCGELYTGELHHRFWAFWYQLWLAERAVHGALLARLRCDAGLVELAAQIVERYCEEYLLYPNRDNVLGPTRLFFSTYLESIWLLNICIAVNLLESDGTDFAALGARARDRIIEPSAAIIAEYDEGASNRQVWNDAALLAANRLLGRNDLVERALFGRSGVVAHLERGLLADGTWYEGENYHLFAHRGLWYGVTMAEGANAQLPRALLDRFQEGFATPFLTALPDMTLPSRRDSQYAISLRQSRFAELCELGLARRQNDGDPRLQGVLYHLYEDPVPRGDTGRARTTADVERNLHPTALSRADLGWRSLLFARPKLPLLRPEPLGTVLLEAQGLAVFRRAHESVYTALDYGTTGGGHGHPDRLNVLLAEGSTRWLDDMGTGSYVDPSLHWYRSTLAHNAPLFDGYEQQRVDGELLAFDERGEAGWVSARALDLGPGIATMRTLVVMSDYVIDEVAWHSDDPRVMDLPIHVDPSRMSIRNSDKDQRSAVVYEGDLLDDTLGALHDATSEWLGGYGCARVLVVDQGRTLHGFLMPSLGSLLYRVMAPGPPGSLPRPMLLLRVASPGGRHWVRLVWTWRDAIERVATDATGAHIFVERRDGGRDHHRHVVSGWRINRTAGKIQRVLDLGGIVRGGSRGTRTHATTTAAPSHALRPGQPLMFELGGDQYRRSEESWEEAGRPTARIGALFGPNELVVDVTVRKTGALTFVAPDGVNPYDNEAADINGDSVQLYLQDDAGASGWVIVPEIGIEDSTTVRARFIEGWDASRTLQAAWRRTDDGYALRMRILLSPPSVSGFEFALGVVVNEKPSDRERRRGQLVLGGAPGEFVYLRGDRENEEQLLRFRISS